MSEPNPLSDLSEALSALREWLDAVHIPFALVGGVAVALLGTPRMTRDIDAVIEVDEEGLALALVTAGRFGLVPRIPDALAFAALRNVLLLEHEPSHVPIDLSIAALPFEHDAIQTATEVSLPGGSTRHVRPEVLLVMKSLAGRARDISDLESILRTRAGLDLAWVRSRVAEHSDALGMPEIAARLEDAVRAAGTH